MDSRTPISDAIRDSLSDAFKAVPDNKRGALVVIADEQGARAMLAAKLGDNWKVAAGVSKPWDGPVTGSVAIMGTW